MKGIPVSTTLGAPERVSARRRRGAPVAIPFPKRKVTRAVAMAELAILEQTYPHAVTALEYQSPFQLLVAVIL
jgi:hypothetical protein